MNLTKSHLLNYYKVERPWDINMVHKVNGVKKFEGYLNNRRVNMFEIDMEDGGGNVKNTTLRHEGVGGASFTWAINKLIKHKKALKLDLKLLSGNPYRSEFFSHALDTLHEHWDTKIPVWISADTLRGPNWENSNHGCLDPTDFIHLYNSYHKKNPKATISLGYSTSFEDDTPAEPYTIKMVSQMRKVIENVEGQATIALRYTNLMKNPKILRGFLELSSVTIWNSEDRVSISQFNQLKKRVRPLNVFKDLTGVDGKPMWS